MYQFLAAHSNEFSTPEMNKMESQSQRKMCETHDEGE